MADKPYDTDTIHTYLKGRMDQETLQKFEEALLNNKELTDEVQWHKDFQDILLLAEKEDLQEHVQQLIEKEKNQDNSKSNETKVVPLPSFWKANRRYLSIAALLAIVFAISFLFFSNESKPLFAKHLETPYFSSPENTRGGAKIDWIKAYQNRDYPQVVTLLQQLEQKSELSNEQKLYMGLAHLYQEDNHTTKAIQYLKAIQQKNPTLYNSTCNWYISLAYLKDGQKEKAKEYLQEITAKQSWKHQEAKQLLEEI